MSVKHLMEQVEAFHEKCRVSATQRMCDKELMSLQVAARLLAQQARGFEEYVGHCDKRFLRAHLLCEEMGELFEAMAVGDELKTLDALADLMYVLVGSAVTMDLPLHLAWEEVHASNMTKEKQPDDPSKERVRSKGPNYRPPNLRSILERYRSGDLR